MLPTNEFNTLGSSQWIAQIDGHKSLVLNLTSFELPAVSVGITTLGGRSEFTYQGGGDHIVYDTLTLNFLVEEDLSNYRKIHQWLRSGVASPDSGLSQETSIFVHLLNNRKNHQGVLVEFSYCHPVNLSELTFDTDGATSSVVCSVTFAYTAFDFIDASSSAIPT